jgi:methionyl-tRNA synthetase
MLESKRYTITAALPYANGPLHIGHLAGAYIAADIYVRYLRLKEKDVIFVCGSDEHGAAITIKAKKENTTPKEIVDKYNALIRKSFEDFGISFDIYHRTSEPIHYETSQDFFRILNNKNAFDVIESEQYFDEDAKQFLADRYIIGTCPKCGNENAYGDQCEKCGSTLNPTDLIHPKSTISGSIPVLRKTKHWFLKLDTQQSEIAAWIETKKDIWKNHVYGQCKSWINDGLRPRAMTRDLDWGIPVPPEIEGSEGKVLYVWLDAPIGYISATKQLFYEIENGKTDFSYPQNFSSFIKDKKADDWKKYWQDEETALVHFIGKDNIVFHCITFPAILNATEQYILPNNVPANEFMNLEGDKISTSRNWAVWLHEYLQEFPGKEDELRYCLIANMPENKDSEFTWQDFQNRVNNELAANIGNFINRVAVLTHKFYDGNIPVSNNENNIVLDEINNLKTKLEASIESFRFKEAMQYAMQISSVGNKFLGDKEPWKLIKTDESKTKEIMSVVVDICKILSQTLIPLLPKTAKKIEQQFNSFKDKINPAQILFEKITDEQVLFQIEKLKKSNENKEIKQEIKSEFTNLKSEISYDDFTKLDIRTGKIIEAEKVPKADKLLKLLVDIGIENRTIVSGIAEHFSPEEIIGKEVSVLVNLAPRKLKGIESNGMILMAEDANGKLYFVQAKDVGAGNVIR